MKKWLKPNKAQISALKSYLRGLAVLGVGYLVHHYGADPAVTAIIAAATAPLLKWLDPSEKSLGIGSNDLTSPK